MDYSDIAETIGCNRHNVVYFLKRNGIEGIKKVSALTIDDRKFVVENHLKYTNEELGKMFGLSKSGMQYYIRTMGLSGIKNKTQPDRTRLSNEEKKFILENFKTMDYQQIADKIGRKIGKVSYFLRTEGLTGYHLWSDINCKILSDNWLKFTDKEMSKMSSHSESAIFAQRMKMGLIRDDESYLEEPVKTEVKVRKNTTNKAWKNEEIDFVKENYDSLSDKEMSVLLNRTTSSVKHRRVELKLFRYTYRSSFEIEISNYLKLNNVVFEEQYVLGKYHYDFKINNCLVEFNGDYYHCNPSIYKNGPINHYQAYTIKKDSEKYAFAQKSGYKIIVLWEKDLKENKEEFLSSLQAVS